MRKTVWIAALGAAVSTFIAAAAGAAPPRVSAVDIDPADYPALDAKEVGHVRRFVKLSRQLPGDWSGMSDDLWAVAERTQQFQLAYMAAALGLVQHQYTPAYRELYREAMHALIQKMTLPDIWESWIQSSRAGTSTADPDAPDLAAGWLDPVARNNIMLKGYLLQAGALYEMLYRDGRYNRPDAFTFRYVANTWGNGPVEFHYSLPDVAQIVHQEYVANNYEGVLCEPNRIFPACNQPPILGLINFDQVYGTKYAAEVMPRFAAAWVSKGYTNTVTKQNVRYIYARQKVFEEPGSPVLDGWSGAWMHAWNPELIATIYPGQRDLYVKNYLSGGYAQAVPDANKAMVSLGFGQVAFMAAEVGDTQSRQQLLDYAERNFNPKWEEGAYYYPRSDDYKTDAQGNSHGVDSWSGNVLLALARLDKGSAFRTLYTQPWTREQLDAPQITEVDYLLTNVYQAYYDPAKRALIVTVGPGPAKADRTQFVVRNLNPALAYTVVKDGRVLGRLSKGSPAAGADVMWRPDGTVSISTTLDATHSFVLAGATQ
ncbi:MAG: hypothetical protein ABI885_23635 [Gammaproteobacteria bacterium]